MAFLSSPIKYHLVMDYLDIAWYVLCYLLVLLCLKFSLYQFFFFSERYSFNEIFRQPFTEIWAWRWFYSSSFFYFIWIVCWFLFSDMHFICYSQLISLIFLFQLVYNNLSRNFNLNFCFALKKKNSNLVVVPMKEILEKCHVRSEITLICRTQILWVKSTKWREWITNIVLSEGRGQWRLRRKWLKVTCKVVVWERT